MKTRYKRYLGVVIAALLILSACSSDDDSTASAPTAAPTTVPAQADEPAEAAPIPDGAMADDEHRHDDGAADDKADGVILTAGELRAILTSTLQEHVYLFGITVEALADADGDRNAPAVVAGLKALDENSLLGASLIGAASPADEPVFLEIWREHVVFFADYAEAAVKDDEAGKTDALAGLAGYQDASGAFFERVTGGVLPAQAVSANFGVHVETVIAAFDAIIAGEPNKFDMLQHAAGHMSVSAQALATGFAGALPDAFPGEIDDAEAETRAALTYALGEHVFLAGISFAQLAEANGDITAPDVAEAFATLDANSVGIAAFIGSLSPDDEEGFLALWREHLGFFTDYAQATLNDDAQGQSDAVANLDGYREASGAFFDRLTGGALPAAAVAENFKGHVDTLNAAIEGVVADTPDFTQLRMAARHMPGTAAALTAGVHG